MGRINPVDSSHRRSAIGLAHCAVGPDLKVSVLHSQRSDCRQKFRTVVGLLTSKQGEGAIPVVTNAEEDSAARPSEPCILIADACTIDPHNNTVVILSFTFKSRKHILQQGLATDGQWLRTCSSVRPGDRLRGPRERFHIVRCTAATADDHDRLVLVRRRASHCGHRQSMWSSSSGSSTPKKHIGGPARWLSNCLIRV